jgi:hypothetical protein
MSGTITTVQQTSDQLHTVYSQSNLLLGNNEFITGNFTASATGDIAEGTVFGRISATGYFKICDKDSADGSQYPVGVLYNGINGALSATSGTTYPITLVNKGKINAGKLVFSTGESLDSVVVDRQFRDHLAAIGLVLESVTELSTSDNQ